MNKTFKTIWNAVRGAYVTVNEAVCGASQKSGSVKLAVLTVAAAAALSAGDVVQASPDYVTSKVGDFNLSKQDDVRFCLTIQLGELEFSIRCRVWVVVVCKLLTELKVSFTDYVYRTKL